jgi:secretion/DNA translocation related TadE-like protein
MSSAHIRLGTPTRAPRGTQTPVPRGTQTLARPGTHTLIRRGTLALERHTHDNRGSGSVLAIALIGAMLACASLLFTLAWALGVKHTVQASAEAAALAAADVASGAIAGYPCERAAEASALGGASLDSCEITGDVATVRISRSVLGFDVAADAKAGPEESSSPAGVPP